MQNSLISVVIIIIGSLLSSCSTSSIKYKGETYNPHTKQIELHNYTPYYQLKTNIFPDQLELLLVTQLHKETIPGAYSLKKYTRRLLPNDYMAQSDVMLYLKNTSDKPIDLELISISVEHTRLPHSARTLSIPEYGSLSLPLGQIAVDLRLTRLNTRIEYIAEQHQEKEFIMERIIRDTVIKQEE